MSLENISGFNQASKVERTHEENSDRVELHERVYDIGKELYESEIILTWPGLSPVGKEYLESVNDESLAPYITPIAQIVQMCEASGIVVHVVANGRNFEVSILPANYTDEQADSIRAQHLNITSFMDGSLAELIVSSRTLAHA